MYGDFSKWPFDTANIVGPLQQQGRVLLDTQQNEATMAMRRWQDDSARAAFGRYIAAVPAWERDAFKVVAAAIAPDPSGTNQVFVTVDAGSAWADGVLVRLAPDGGKSGTTARRIADYLTPPLESVPGDVGADGTRDAVILEVWRSALSAFQDPSLLEPALGGPDSYELLQTQFAFRLFRMGPDDTCETIRRRIQDDFSSRGRLTVSLAPTTVTPGDCPVVEGGGYSGFEHNLYRVEIAELDGGQPPMFKWSQFNGGLVGTGIFDATQTPPTLTIVGNQPAIVSSQLSDCYIEALDFDAERGRWRLTYAAPGTIGNDATISLKPATFGALPSGSTPHFFRVWNGVRLLSDFPATASPPVELRDGIRLQFDAAATDPATPSYVPYDYWTFAVRAGDIGNPQVLVDDQPPVGVHHHRVPLGVLEWTGGTPLSAPDEIEDCRVPFQPLTAPDCCCTFTVGDEGDFAKIQDAIDALPPDGGHVCVQAGTYTENVTLQDLTNVILSGCGPQTIIQSAPPQVELGSAAPVIHVLGGQSIRIEGLTLIADPTGVGVLLEEDQGNVDTGGGMPLVDVTLQFLDVTASGASAIEMDSGRTVRIRDCNVNMVDVETMWPGIMVTGTDITIERNRVVVERRLLHEAAMVNDETVDREVYIAGNATAIGSRLAVGGIWLRGGTSLARVIGNFIEGGIGNGITLGSADLVQIQSPTTSPGSRFGSILGRVGWIYGFGDQCGSCDPGGTYVPPGSTNPGGGTYVAGDPLDHIVIEGNLIFGMGLDGIGVFAFFGDAATQGIITVSQLRIAENLIYRCLLRSRAALPDAVPGQVGYGGIALADVEEAIITNNEIVENGLDWLQATCGIFIVHAVDVEIAGNQIARNGRRTSDGPSGARPGPRGGIWVTTATAGTVTVTSGEQEYLTPDGLPALRVHGNRIEAPLGRALTVAVADGPISVVGNRLTTRAVAPTWDNQLGAAVYILDVAIDREIATASNLSFSSAATSKTFLGAAAEPTLTPDGNVLFADNQVALETVDNTGTLLSSLFIVTLDDLAFTGNQCDAFLAGRSIVIAHLFALAVTMRCNDNRLKENLQRFYVSALNIGLFANIAAGNVSTHCILTLPVGGNTIKANNVELTAGSLGSCEQVNKAMFVNGFSGVL